MEQESKASEFEEVRTGTFASARNVVFFLGVVVLINFFSLCVLYTIFDSKAEKLMNQQNEMLNKISNYNEKLIENTSTEAKKAIKLVQKQLQEKGDTLISEYFKTLQNSADTAINKLQDKTSKAIDSFEKTAVATASGIENSANVVASLASKKLKENEVRSKKAFLLAKEKKEKGEYGLARLYLMNAINHEPDNVIYLNGLCELLKQDGNLQTIQEARSILQLSIYQMATTDIPVVLKHLEYIDDMERKLMANVGKDPDIDLNKVFDDFQKKIGTTDKSPV